ncbi:MAG: FG-GAP-like repeat-containing protein [Thermodesulfobacteriota bacterium]
MHKKELTVPRCLILVFTVLLSLFGMTTQLYAAAPAPAKKVAFLPFEAHAAKDLSYLTSGIRDMLSSRLAAGAKIRVIDRASVDKAIGSAKLAQPEQFRAIGKTVGADYVVAGSLTAIGTSMSLDAKVFSVAGDDPAQTFFASAAAENEIIGAIDQLAWEIGGKVFGAQKPGSVAAPVAASQPAQPQYLSAHPERAFMGQDGRGASPFIRPLGSTGPFGFSKSQNFNMYLQAMDVGDVDGDGQDEVILADRSEVGIYKRDGKKLQKVGQIATIAKYKIHYVSVADLNHNGKAEIYVSAADEKEPNSFAVEWQGKNKVEYLFKDARWYIRTLELPKEGMTLLGQRAAVSKPIMPGVFRLDLVKGDLVKGAQVQLPEWVNVFDFAIADLDSDGSNEVVAIDQYDRLVVAKQSGTTLWKSDDFFGGTNRFIGGRSAMGQKGAMDDTGDPEGRTYIPSRMVIADLNKDGVVDVLVNKNLSTSSRLFKNMKNYPSGELHALTWNGIALTEIWRTRKIDGYIADYLLRPDKKEPTAELLVGLVLRQGDLDLVSSKNSTVLMYNLDFSEAEKAPKQE